MPGISAGRFVMVSLITIIRIVYLTKSIMRCALPALSEKVQNSVVSYMSEKSLKPSGCFYKFRQYALVSVNLYVVVTVVTFWIHAIR